MGREDVGVCGVWFARALRCLVRRIVLCWLPVDRLELAFDMAALVFGTLDIIHYFSTLRVY